MEAIPVGHSFMHTMIAEKINFPSNARGKELEEFRDRILHTIIIRPREKSHCCHLEEVTDEAECSSSRSRTSESATECYGSPVSDLYEDVAASP